MMRSSTPIIGKLFAFLAIALFAAPHVGTAADDLFFPSISPTATASPSPALHSEGSDKSPSAEQTRALLIDPSASMDPSDLPSMLPSSSLSPTTEAEKLVKIFNYTGIIESYTIPEDGVYTFGAVGGKGGDCDGYDKSTCNLYGGGCDAQHHEGGYGARASSTFVLHKGDQIEIIVGGRGDDCRKVRKDFNPGELSPGFGRNYLEPVAGAGGGGASSVRVKYAADGREDVLLGEDGESGRDGGWAWGGKGGKGGGLDPSASTDTEIGHHGGAGGGGVYGNGDSQSSDQTGIVTGIVAEGGESLSDGAGRGGFVDFSDDSTISGGFGGFGGGAQGGYGQCGRDESGGFYFEYSGGGGGGGGFSGGGGGGGGNGAGGGGSLGVEIERHVGGGDGYVVIEKAIVSPNFLLFYEGARKQTVRAPKTGRYTVTAIGAKGGNCDVTTCELGRDDWCAEYFDPKYHEGGYRAQARGTFLLSEGDEIDVVVAGRGGDCRSLIRSGGATYTATGGSGGGASSVRVRRSDGQNEELLLAAAGGGGAGFSFHGEDGQTSPFGGWSWGGAFGGGGTIPNGASEYSGAAGGGVYGDGASRLIKVEDSNGAKDKNERIWAKGGSSILDGGFGGFVDRYMGHSNVGLRIRSGPPGGYGGGGQGGIGKVKDREEPPRGGGGGGGGYSGGGPAIDQGGGGAGGGSIVADIAWPGTAAIEGHKGYLDGYVIIVFEEDDGAVCETYTDTEGDGTVYHTYTGRRETVTIAEDGEYDLTAVGGRGGSCNDMTLPNGGGRIFKRGGYGAQASGTFRFSKGDQLHLTIGGKGGDCNTGWPISRSGAGGAGGTFIEWVEGTSKKQELLLVTGGGGGAGNTFDGGDGEKGPDGGFEWGGKNGQGGGVCQEGEDCESRFFLNGGAGGGGYYGDGASRCNDGLISGLAASCGLGSTTYVEGCSEDNVLAAGGKSFRKGSEGGQQVVDVDGSYATYDKRDELNVGCEYKYASGGFGGFGGGGEGGIFRWVIDEKNDDKFSYENGGGGGGGGFSGGGAGQFQGLGGGGGGSYFNDDVDAVVPGSCFTTEKVGAGDGYVIIRKVSSASPSSSLAPSLSLLPSLAPTSSMKPTISANPTVGLLGIGNPGPLPGPAPEGKSGKAAPLPIFT